MKYKLEVDISDARISECLDGKYICGENTNLLTAYEHLAGFWKTIDLMFSKLTYFFSLCVNIDLIPVEIYAIRKSLEVYYSTIEQNRSNVRPVECLIVFMSSFKEIMQDFIHIQLVDSAGYKWSLKSAESIEQWARDKSQIKCTINYDEANISAFDDLIIPLNISRILAREKHSSIKNDLVEV